MSQSPRITDTLPETQAAYLTLSRLAAEAGICASLALNDYGAFRTASDTADILGFRDADYAVYVRALKKQNPAAVPVPKTQWRKIAPFQHSFHDVGAAFDVTLKGIAKGLTYSAALHQVAALAHQAGLRWGGTFGDPPHFELDVSLAQAAQMWADYTARRGKYAAAAPAAAEVLSQAGDAVGDAVDHAAAQASIAAEKLGAGVVPPVAVALFAAVTLGAIGALVLRKFGLFT